MSKLSIPSFSFPTTVLFLDDNIDFLKSVAMGLSTDFATYNFYSDPHKALSLLNEKYKSDNFADGLINLVDEEELEHRTIDINVKDLYLLMYNRARFQQISTVVVDYHMPGMNGIEFCEKIKNPNIQKILLTSIVDESKAIEVLNAGLIHTFIRKQSLNVIELLNQAIAQAQERYFLGLSRIIDQVLHCSPDESALCNPDFVELFKKLLKEFKVVEFYLAEWLGSFVFLDAHGRHFGLFTRNKEQIASYCESSQAEKAPKELLKELKKGSKILCYHNEKNHPLPDGLVWEQYIFDANVIKGKNKYLCAYGPEMFDVNTSKLLSFNNYSSPMGITLG